MLCIYYSGSSQHHHFIYKYLTIKVGIPKFVFLQCSDPIKPFKKLTLTVLFEKMYNNYFIDIKYIITIISILFIQLLFWAITSPSEKLF